MQRWFRIAAGVVLAILVLLGVALFTPLADPELSSHAHPAATYADAANRIDAVKATEWKKYDIRLLLERRWPELGPKLAGKLHVIQGELDTFYLDGATRLRAFVSRIAAAAQAGSRSSNESQDQGQKAKPTNHVFLHRPHTRGGGVVHGPSGHGTRPGGEATRRVVPGSYDA